MKILVLNYEYPPIGGGGGRVSQDLGRQFARRGRQITVLTSRIRGLPREDWDDGVRVRRVRWALPLDRRSRISIGSSG